MISPNLSGRARTGASRRELRATVVTSALSALVFAIVTLAALTLAARPLQAQARVRRAHLRAAEALPAPVKSYGSKAAPIHMDVFTDYACPTCRAFFLQTLQPLIGDYVASGKVYLVHHDYPLELPGHENSSQAARWANVAAEFGQFEPVEAALYENQSAWAASGDIAKYVAAAVSHPDFQRISKVMDACQAPGPRGRPGAVDPSPHPCGIDSYIEKDVALANQIPLQATPTYVITYKGQRLPPGSGFVSWPVLRQFFDTLLKQ